MKKRTWFDMEKISKFGLPATILWALFLFSLSVYRGSQLNVDNGVWLGIAGGILSAGIVIGTYPALKIWEIFSDKIADFMSKYPKIRFFVFLILLLSSSYFSVYVLFLPNLDNLARAIAVACLGLIFPASIFSIVREIRRRENFALLGEYISLELVNEKPQAAVEHAFTIFEDRLRQKISAGPGVFGTELINQAFSKDGRLSYGDVEGEKIGARNFLAGAYATFRNPRKHRVMNETRQSALEIISLIELMLQVVDEAKDNQHSSDKPAVEKKET